ncbi:fasciclin domain-containing protein [Lutibacter sp.]|uniref:fasciclin domain-containing protein n=1 Tax=Lutibacter sp. TaxID=1925666 RepID=UPI0025BC442B|nr:fasciclin domain-containing protein [Lutibacter sp.]MCF6168454.1 fasciclin domain-containing protein [Lutibacter sp.]
MKKINLTYTLLAVLALFIVSCNGGDKKPENKTTKTEVTPQGKGQSAVEAVEGEEPNVLQVAKSLDDFKTLVVAVEAAGVEDALVNAGPLTVFAPVNSAFDKLPEGTVETLLKPENKGKLAFILVNHVAPSNYPIKQLKKEAKKGRKLYMASGKYLVVENKDDGIYVGGTKILKSVKVSNGWIHVIGDVLVPAE